MGWRLILRLLAASCVNQCWGRELFAGGGLVGPGALQPYGGPRERRSYSTISKFPVGFYVGGSSIAGVNGLYRRVDRDHFLPHFAEHTYVNDDTKWGMAYVFADGSEGHKYEAVGGKRMEWLIYDPDGRHRFGHAGETLLPGAGPSWSHTRRVEYAGRFRPGEKVRTRTLVQGGSDALWEANAEGVVTGVGADANAPIALKLEGGRSYNTQAWRLQRSSTDEVPLCRGGGDLCDCWTVCKAAGYCSHCDSAFGTRGACCKRGEPSDPTECQEVPLDGFEHSGYHTCVLTLDGAQEVVEEGSQQTSSADELPWQVIGIMTEGQLNDLLRQKREYDERASRASVDMAKSLPQLPRHGGQGPASDFVPKPELKEMCGTGQATDALDRLTDALAAAAGDAGLKAALQTQRSFCFRRLSDPAAALSAVEEALAPFPRYGVALFERALALLDSGRPQEAVGAFEALLGVEPQWPGLQDWLLHAHARCRRRGRAPVHGGVYLGDTLQAVAHYNGMWAKGEPASVVGLGNCHAPIKVLTRNGRKINTQVEHFMHVGQQNGVAVATKEDEPDHYSALRLQADFTAVELKRAYKEASKRCHPDLGGSDTDFARVAEANRVLGDPTFRRTYDRGEDLPVLGDAALHLEVAQRYFPADAGFQPFGDPLKDRRQREERDRAEAERRQRLEADRRQRLESAEL